MPAPGYLHPTLRNIAPDLEGKGFDLAALGREIVDDYKRDRGSRTDWEGMHEGWVKLYYQKDKPIARTRWQGASDESLPILTEACNQYHTRMYAAMFGNREIVVARPSGRVSGIDTERAKRISLHMTWQLTVQDDQYKREKDRLLLGTTLHGTTFTKAFRDPWLDRNVVKNVRALDLVMPYGIGPRSIADIERKTEVVWTTVNNTRLLAEVGYLSAPGTPTDKGAEHHTAPDITIRDLSGFSETTGEEDYNKPCLLLESHRLVDFDGDGLAEPYIVTVDAETNDVLRVAIRWDTDELGNPLDAPWYDLKKPTEYYTQYSFLENPDGTYGLGLGHILGELNKACNRILRELIDAGMLATAGNLSGFINAAAAGPQGGDIQLEFGRFKKLPLGSEDLNKLFKTFDFKGPAPALLQALELLLQRSDRLGLNTEAVTGQLERVLQPTTVLALLEQSNTGFGAVNERVITAWTEELAKLYRLNGRHLAPEEYFAVLDMDGAMVPSQIARDDYAPDFQVIPTVDPQRVTEKERLQRAQMEWQFLATSPLVTMSPIHFYNAHVRYARALRIDNIPEVIPNPLMMPPDQIAALMAAMIKPRTDETGLPADGSGQPAVAGSQGMAGSPGDAMGVPAASGAGPGNGLENGSSGGTSPSPGQPGGRGLAARAS